jgi:transcriptional regulator with XRE-family HTH domain
MALEIGRRVRALRQKRSLTQAALASRANLNQGFVSEIERGNRNPSHTTLQVLAKALAVPASALVAGPYDAASLCEDVKELPMFADVPRDGLDANRDGAKTYPVPRHLWRPDRYVLRLTSQSLEPTLKPDDLVLVQSRPGVPPRHVQGKICICLLDGELVMGRLSVEQHGPRAVVVLRGDDPAVAPVVADEARELHVEAVVIFIIERVL